MVDELGGERLREEGWIVESFRLCRVLLGSYKVFSFYIE